SLYDYSSGMWNTDRGDPASERLPLSQVLARIPGRARNVLVVLGSRMQEDVPRAANVIGGVVLLVALGIATCRRARGGAGAELFAWAGIASVLPYFSFQDRLLMPVMLVAWTCAAELLETLGARVLGTRRAPIAACAPALVLLAFDFHPRANWDAVRR